VWKKENLFLIQVTNLIEEMQEKKLLGVYENLLEAKGGGEK